MAAITVAVQAGIWPRGLHDLVGYATDYAFGLERGRQTLVMKTHNRSAYVRLQGDSILGAAGGANLGHELENRQRSNADQYRIALRMEDGSYQTLMQSTSAHLRVSDRVGAGRKRRLATLLKPARGYALRQRADESKHDNARH
jgi:hypothetical protein